MIKNLGDNVDEWSLDELKKIALDFKVTHKSENTPDYFNTDEDLFADFDFGNSNIFKSSGGNLKRKRSKKSEEIDLGLFEHNMKKVKKPEFDFGEFENVPIGNKKEEIEEKKKENVVKEGGNDKNFLINYEKESTQVLDFFKDKPIVQVIK